MRHQNAAHLGAAREADVANHIAGAQHLADGNGVVGIGTEDVEYAGRNASAHGQFGHGQCGQWRELRWFDNDGATCRQGRGHLAGDHGQRKIPWCDGCANADGLFEHHQTAVIVELGQGLAVNAFGLFGVPLHKAGTVGYFAFGFWQWLALFRGHQAAQVILVGHQQIKPFAQNDAALFAGFAAPGRPGGVGGSNGGFGIGWAHIGHIGQFLVGGGVQHIKT